MPRDINERLESLQKRRRGTDARSAARLSDSARLELVAKSLIAESWQKRAAAMPYTRYALGAMEAVGEQYTRVGIETAQRVGNQLVSKLPIPIVLRLQGSVPLDVHIRGVSDVDLLTIHGSFITYSNAGARSLAGLYTSPSPRTSLEVLWELRANSETVLKDAYPAAKVDCTGGKCIAISGGSLARPVDIVPSHWWDTVEYQSSGQERDRGVEILNKKVPIVLENLPFLHIDHVHNRDATVFGGLKKAIRLAKNVKNDAESSALADKLPSFDIASLLYHADLDALRAGYAHELAILRETLRFFDWCYNNKPAARLLRTPDGSRYILDTEDKLSGLMSISVELDKLATEVAKEQLKGVVIGDPTWPQIDTALRNSLIAAAA
jgi:hypothetical protein